MNKLISILFISIHLVSFFSCKKDAKTEPDTGFNTPVNTDLYAYAYFKPGTYWIYQDSISGILDSVYITSANKGTYTNGDAEVAQGYYRGTFSWFKCEMISSYDHYKYQNWMDQSYEVTSNTPIVKRVKIQMPNSGTSGGTTINLAIVPVGKILYVQLDHVLYETFYSNFNVKNINFLFTQKWYNFNSNCDDDQNTYYYIAKNVGIIRREQLDSNRTWNLIRYNIIQ
jgi:hypothetical protein